MGELLNLVGLSTRVVLYAMLLAIVVVHSVRLPAGSSRPANHPITRSPDYPITRLPDYPITRLPDHPIRSTR
jgi:hypothetical protein